MHHVPRQTRLLAFAAAALFASAAALAAEGDLDPSFDDDGRNNFDLSGTSTLPKVDRDILQRAAVLADGTILAAGTPDVDSDTDAQSPLFIARLTGDGTLTGTQVVGLGSQRFAYGGQVTAAGKILVSGESTANGYYQALVRRYGSTGALEAEFVNAGSTTSQSGCNGMLVDTAGRIVAACTTGYTETPVPSASATLIRLNADLTPDTTFSGDGRAPVAVKPDGVSFTYGENVAQDASGNYYLLGAAESGDAEQPFVARLNPNGVLDTGFGEGGLAMLGIPGGAEVFAEAIAVDADGSIYVGGEDYHEENNALSKGFIARFTSLGVLDSGFAGDGVYEMLTNNSEGWTALQLVPRPDGRLIVVGTQGLFRLDADGSKDAGWTTQRHYELAGNTNPTQLGGLAVLDGDDRALLMGGVCGGCLDYSGSEDRNAFDAFIAKVRLTDVVDTVPNAFAFADQASVAAGAEVTSNAVTITGIDSPAAISVSGGGSSAYSVNGGGFVAFAGTVVDGDSVRVRHTAAAVAGGIVGTTLVVGGVADTFTSTVAADTAPDAFTFRAKRGVEPGASSRSSIVTIAGLSQPVAISVAGDPSIRYARNGGSFTNVAGTIGNGDTLQLRLTAGPLAGEENAVSGTVTVGSYTTGFAVETIRSKMVDPYDFPDRSGQPADRNLVSAVLVPTGHTLGVRASVTGDDSCRLKIGDGLFARRGTLYPGDTLQLRLRSAVDAGATRACTVLLGETADGWAVTTAP